MTKPNLPKLRAAYIDARKAWLRECAARGVDMYSDAAEGGHVGRGKARERDYLGRLFDAHEAAKRAYIGGRDERPG